MIRSFGPVTMTIAVCVSIAIGCVLGSIITSNMNEFGGAQDSESLLQKIRQMRLWNQDKAEKATDDLETPVGSN